jgi:PncC family amidohydrolase
MGKQLSGHAAEVIRLAQEKRLTLATVESCTGGRLVQLLVDVPDVGETVHGGLVVYTKQNKIVALGVPEDLIHTYTAVSKEVALAMAQAALAGCPADVTVSVTGVAGPAPDEDGNPVGLVYVAASTREGDHLVERHHFSAPSKPEMLNKSLEAALRLLQVILRKATSRSAYRGDA